MPASVSTFLTTQSVLDVRYMQKALWDAFESDFGKYAKGHQHRHLRRILGQIPRLIGDHVKYSRIDPELPNPARDIKQAIELLRLAGLLHPILASSAGGLPLLSGLKETVFKLIFLDIGMVEQAMNVDPRHSDLMSGPLAEQFVGQEFLAASDPLLGERLFFWARDGGTAEVDYLIAHEGMIYPVEVKAGKSGKLKSLYLFLDEKRSALGIKISQEALQWDPQRKVLSVPLYLAAHLPRLITGIQLA